MGRPWKIEPLFPEVDKAIKERGSVKDFARATGACFQTYYKIQQGRTWPGYWFIVAVLDYTGKPFEELFRIKK